MVQNKHGWKNKKEIEFWNIIKKNTINIEKRCKKLVLTKMMKKKGFNQKTQKKMNVFTWTQWLFLIKIKKVHENFNLKMIWL